MKRPLLTSILLFVVLSAYNVSAEYPTYDGSNNNREFPTLGTSGTAMRRSSRSPANYHNSDGSSTSGSDTPFGDDLGFPPPRKISNSLFVGQSKLDLPKSDMHLYFGKFMIYDIIQTRQNQSEPWHIKVPACDIKLDPFCRNNIGDNTTIPTTIPFYRNDASRNDPGSPRSQINYATSYIDGSHIYGTNTQEASTVRTWQGGRIHTEIERLLIPKKIPQVVALAVLFSMEHNRYCDVFAQQHPEWDDETIFQEAKKWNVAVLQKIFSREWLSALTGSSIGRYYGYLPSVDPSVDNLAAGFAFRYAHSQISSIIPRVDSNGQTIPQGHLLLRDCYGANAVKCLDQGIEPIIFGMMSSAPRAITNSYVDDVRNYVGTEMPVQIMDLAAIDIQRSRDHGTAWYGDLAGLWRVASPNSSMSPGVKSQIQQIYGNIDEIDPLVAALAIGGRGGGSLPPDMVSRVITDQINRTRHGDRFWYENQIQGQIQDDGGAAGYQFLPEQISQVYGTMLSHVITNHFNVSVPTNVFWLNTHQLESAPHGFFPEEDYYENTREMSSVFRLSWTLNKVSAEISFRIQCLCDGWVAIGLEPDPNTMKNADIMYFQVINGNATGTDAYAIDIGVPSTDSRIGGTSDIYEVRGSHTPGYLVVQWKRKLTTNDPYDKPITPGSSRVIFAYHPTSMMLTYHGPTRKASTFIDFFTTRLLEEHSFGVVVFLAVLLGVVGVLAIALGICIKVFRQAFIFQSPLFCQLIVFGAVIGYCGVALLLPTPTDDYCVSSIWLFGTSFVLIIGSLFVKTYRMWYVVSFSVIKLRGIVISNQQLLSAIGVALILEWSYLALWTGLDSPKATIFPNTYDDTVHHLRCRSNSDIFPLIFLGYKLAILLLGLIIAFKLRNFPPELNESKNIIFAVFILSAVASIAVPLSFILYDFINGHLLVFSLGVIIAITAILCLLFLPTAVQAIWSGQQMRDFAAMWRPPATRSAANNSSGTLQSGALYSNTQVSTPRGNNNNNNNSSTDIYNNNNNNNSSKDIPMVSLHVDYDPPLDAPTSPDASNPPPTPNNNNNNDDNNIQ